MDDKPKLAAVLPMRDTTLRDVPANLRKLADAIEAGDHGIVSKCALILSGSEVSVFAYGDCDIGAAHVLFAIGSRVLEESAMPFLEGE